MKIHIITGHFYPQLHPRAFRANELAIEFARRGHDVSVTNCWKIKGFDYDEYGRKNNIRISNLNLFITSAEGISNSSSSKSQNKLKKFVKNYFFAGSFFFRGPRIAQEVKIDSDTDLVIALSTPFTCVYGVSRYLKKHGKRCVAIADSGDPFYNSQQSPKAIWFKHIEKSVYKQYDYLTIPTENAIPLYAPMIDREKIKIIPQGFNMDNLNLYKGDFEGPIRIAYAGVFYRDIRNPEFLFRHLASVKKKFELHLFMRERDTMVDEYIEKYPSLKGKVFVTSLPHDKLLYELSRMHFLVNIENLSNTQLPSKLIDYGMAGRPIFSCNSTNFSPEKLNRFIDGDYSGEFEVDVKRYNIKHIADEFLELYCMKLNK